MMHLSYHEWARLPSARQVLGDGYLMLMLPHPHPSSLRQGGEVSRRGSQEGESLTCGVKEEIRKSSWSPQRKTLA